MRKKIKKYADGGAVRNSRPSLISNNPVGSNRARGLTPVGATAIEEGGRDMEPYTVVVEADRLPSAAAPAARAAVAQRRRAARRGPSADDLNDREMTRILNDRSLDAARAGRNMYKKGGKVSAKKKSTGKK